MLGAQPTRLLRLSGGGLCGVRWRPTRFAEDTVQRYACSLCGVIPNSTQLLPCGHALCETCEGGSGQDGAGGVCPLDQDRFYEEECIRIPFPARKLESLKAFCWNEGHGCPFSGTLPDVLHHYEEDCSYHTVECPRCSNSVQYSELSAHYSISCRSTVGTDTVQHEPPHNGGVFGLRDVNAALEEFEAVLRESHQDQLPALQSKLNELSEEVTNHGCLLREMGRTLREMYWDQDERVSGDRMPWPMEQRHILRRLNLLVTESLARVHYADIPPSHLKGVPTVSCVSYTGPYGASANAIARICFPTEGPDGEEKTYLFSVSNMKANKETLHRPSGVVGEITQWYNRYLYFTLAVIISNREDMFEISLRFDGTVASARQQPSRLDVYIVSDNQISNEMEKFIRGQLQHDGLGPEHVFWKPLSVIRKLHLLRDGSIDFLVVLGV